MSCSPTRTSAWRSSSNASRRVEEKFGKYFGYLARCEENFRTTNFRTTTLLDQNADTDSAKIWKFYLIIIYFKNLDFRKIWNRHTKTWKNTKSAPQNLKFDFDLEFLGQKIDFENSNIILQLLSNFDSTPKNLKLPTSNPPQSTFSRQKSNFSSTKILILY